MWTDPTGDGLALVELAECFNDYDHWHADHAVAGRRAFEQFDYPVGKPANSVPEDACGAEVYRSIALRYLTDHSVRRLS